MFKQFINKLARKSWKSESADYGGSNSGNNAVTSGSRNAVSGRSNAVKRMSSAVFPASVVSGIEPLISFKDVPNQEKQNLFVSKLNLCSVVFDFDDPNKNSVEKDLKRQTLIELVDFVSSGSAKFTEPAIAAMCKMSAVNLFRMFQPNYQSTGGEAEVEEPMFDLAWPHLQLVYDLLLRFMTSTSLDAKIGKKYIDHSFILRLLDLFDSDDPRERDCLKTILHRIYGKFMVHRPFIRKAVSNIFYRFVFETERHNGIAELLDVFGSVISGFAVPLKEEHKMFLWTVLIPLHKPKSLGVYLQQLTYCVTQFLEKEPKLASTVIKGLLKYWPITNSQKEVMFLGSLEEILEGMNMVEFQKIMVPLFRRIGCCLSSSHFQRASRLRRSSAVAASAALMANSVPVAEQAHLLWNNDHIVNLIAHNRQVILPLIFPSLERNTRSHWNQAVLNLTLNVKKVFSEVDEELVLTCQDKFEEEETKLKAAAEKRRVTWERLEIAASVQPVTRNAAILVTPTTTYVTG
ncbi:hypothetical protein HHK36_014035 [Tetracentron sinense]|uniref:Serine/threonine protein phosphatase 2A regulatory subunit n=1 Tax=Tetracentron sinense TaxID=13715 RepID=A0A834Z772_TETSI|nr:hypothetical protein HHK36_014035 [Tetracentron sinense]